MLLLLKYWIAVNGLNDRNLGGMGAFPLLCMAIRHLQNDALCSAMQRAHALTRPLNTQTLVLAGAPGLDGQLAPMTFVPMVPTPMTSIHIPYASLLAFNPQLHRAPQGRGSESAEDLQAGKGGVVAARRASLKMSPPLVPATTEFATGGVRRTASKDQSPPLMPEASSPVTPSLSALSISSSSPPMSLSPPNAKPAMRRKTSSASATASLTPYHGPTPTTPAVSTNVTRSYAAMAAKASSPTLAHPSPTSPSSLVFSKEESAGADASSKDVSSSILGLQSLSISALSSPKTTMISSPSPPLVAATPSLTQALLRFLVLYGHQFDYMRHGISVRENGMFFFKETSPFEPDPTRPFLLCLESPTNPSVDIGRNTTRITLVQRSLQTLLAALTSALQEVDNAAQAAAASPKSNSPTSIPAKPANDPVIFPLEWSRGPDVDSPAEQEATAESAPVPKQFESPSPLWPLFAASTEHHAFHSAMHANRLKIAAAAKTLLA